MYIFGIIEEMVVKIIMDIMILFDVIFNNLYK